MDIHVSEIGFGAWGIGGTVGGAIAYGETEDRESRLALRLAYDLGVTFYDTSDFYGFGHSEKLIGETLKDVRDKIVIATKVGFLQDGKAQDFSVQHIRSSIEQSLKRLGTDYIDLYQLHSPLIQHLKEDGVIMETLHSLVDEGKVRAFGISARSPQDALIAAKSLHFKVVQANFNLVDQRALTNGLFDFCEKEGVGFIARTPLCFGFLTNAYSAQSHFSSGDHRSLLSTEQIKKWDEARQLFLNIFETSDDQSCAQFALRFCLSYKAVSTIIPGMLNREHVRENIFSSSLGKLPTDKVEALEKVYRENTFFLGKYSSLKES